tara:strand:+ start:18733 stop:19062 length:330 start_codon:yes stop_codon:yes gene_type:complete
LIFHILSQSDYDLALARGFYRPESLEKEGFIHFSSEDQVEKTAKRFYLNQKNLLLLKVDPSQLKHKLIVEPADGDEFPHLYGDLNLDAITEVFTLNWDQDQLIRNNKSS